MEQASKALNFCVSTDEFEGSSERVSYIILVGFGLSMVASAG